MAGGSENIWLFWNGTWHAPVGHDDAEMWLAERKDPMLEGGLRTIVLDLRGEEARSLPFDRGLGIEDAKRAVKLITTWLGSGVPKSQQGQMTRLLGLLEPSKRGVGRSSNATGVFIRKKDSIKAERHLVAVIAPESALARFDVELPEGVSMPELFPSPLSINCASPELNPSDDREVLVDCCFRARRKFERLKFELVVDGRSFGENLRGAFAPARGERCAVRLIFENARPREDEFVRWAPKEFELRPIF